MKTTRAKVFRDKELAGFLTKEMEGYTFTYEEAYYRDSKKPPISVNFPKSNKDFRSKKLFPFFFGLLAEGENKNVQCRTLRIDERDHFTRLIKTAHSDTIGSVTIKEDAEN
jgi:serine/threonine-protein kinase HipA